jgi:hypothetical protein
MSNGNNGNRRKPMTKGSIVTNSNGFSVYKGGRFFCSVEWQRGNASHLDAVKFVARKYFGTGTLRRTSSVELPCDRFDRWGFTRENRPVGEVSVEVSHYQVVG